MYPYQDELIPNHHKKEITQKIRLIWNTKNDNCQLHLYQQYIVIDTGLNGNNKTVTQELPRDLHGTYLSALNTQL